MPWMSTFCAQWWSQEAFISRNGMASVAFTNHGASKHVDAMATELNSLQLEETMNSFMHTSHIFAISKRFVPSNPNVIFIPQIGQNTKSIADS
jgi:hypothetical protein